MKILPRVENSKSNFRRMKKGKLNKVTKAKDELSDQGYTSLPKSLLILMYIYHKQREIIQKFNERAETANFSVFTMGVR